MLLDCKPAALVSRTLDSFWWSGITRGHFRSPIPCWLHWLITSNRPQSADRKHASIRHFSAKECDYRMLSANPTAIEVGRAFAWIFALLFVP